MYSYFFQSSDTFSQQQISKPILKEIEVEERADKNDK